MGLLEKALKYKQEVNSKGKETLIDRIQGPADTQLLDNELLDTAGEEKAGVKAEIFNDDLFELPEDNEERFAPAPDVEESELSVAAGTNHKKQILQETKGSGNSADNLDDEDPLGPEDEPDLSKASLLRDGNMDEEIIDTELDITILENGDQPEVQPRNEGVPGATANSPEQGKSAGAGTTDFDEKGFAERVEKGVELTSQRNRKFHDFLVLYEIGKEIIRAGGLKEIYEILLFSIMGQIGVSSISILIPGSSDPSRWSIADSRGITVRDKNIVFKSNSGIIRSLIEKRRIIDMDEYKGLPDFKYDYFSFISIDTRLIAPISYDDKIFGALVMGEKISIGDYTEEEKDFVKSIGEIAAMAIEKIAKFEHLKGETEKFKKKCELSDNLDSLQESVGSSVDFTGLIEPLGTFFENWGVRKYCVYVLDKTMDSFRPAVADRIDSLGLKKNIVSIPAENPLAELLGNTTGFINIEDFRTNEIVSSIFDETAISKMSFLWAYPARAGKRLIGFILVFESDENGDDVNSKNVMKSFSDFVIPTIFQKYEQRLPDKQFMDFAEVAAKRLGLSLSSAIKQNIPFTIVLFSIKNFKRYQNLYGEKEAEKLLETFKTIISSRISQTDYAIRLDMHKVLMALPGKNKKYGIPLANAIRNEMIQQFQKKEMQLMLVYLTAEYPEDGENVLQLLESLE